MIASSERAAELCRSPFTKGERLPDGVVGHAVEDAEISPAPSAIP